MGVETVADLNLLAGLETGDAGDGSVWSDYHGGALVLLALLTVIVSIIAISIIVIIIIQRNR